mmetsp:Transcript_3778/g.10882  ORF Transcript_3778/g.10882 Transcript_3778/m.10882 type:complete len:129 (-) Transcript_3778:158-544(-)|eukprot:CAMPEP_0206147686 /NCGR_PEP_ID=MMETSP1473-20131121/34211_1 /ASSEMBLY_ACC=CAM_ASM_001109 /TAXON_ID=1461547 /ORGANISM="Stichococcus sp, Strain RCC1054" /LENGTH=128 /DNA_ID=CAMNT_0053544725 /DNA_START=215 /DNA_END=601 /DNA_ORIENTATION=-
MHTLGPPRGAAPAAPFCVGSAVVVYDATAPAPFKPAPLCLLDPSLLLTERNQPSLRGADIVPRFGLLDLSAGLPLLCKGPAWALATMGMRAVIDMLAPTLKGIAVEPRNNGALADHISQPLKTQSLSL